MGLELEAGGKLHLPRPSLPIADGVRELAKRIGERRVQRNIVAEINAVKHVKSADPNLKVLVLTPGHLERLVDVSIKVGKCGTDQDVSSA